MCTPCISLVGFRAKKYMVEYQDPKVNHQIGVVWGNGLCLKGAIFEN